MDAVGRPPKASTNTYGLSKLAIMLNRSIFHQGAVSVNWLADCDVPAIIGPGAGQLEGGPPNTIAEVAVPLGVQ